MIEEPLTAPTARSVQVWESIVETHKQHLEREAKLASRGTEKEAEKKETADLTIVSEVQCGKKRSEETKGRESRWEYSSSSEEEEDATGDLGVRGKRISFKRAFGYRGEGHLES